MEANAARLRGDDLPPAVPAALLAAGMLLEFAALERWQPAFMEDPAFTTAPPPPTVTDPPPPPEAPPPAPFTRTQLRPRSCFPRFAVRFGPEEVHFPDAQVTQLTPLARWMSEHPGVTVTARAPLDALAGDEARQQSVAQMRLAAVTWRLIALGVPRDKLAEALDRDVPRSSTLTFSAGGFRDCADDEPVGGAP